MRYNIITLFILSLLIITVQLAPSANEVIGDIDISIDSDAEIDNIDDVDDVENVNTNHNSSEILPTEDNNNEVVEVPVIDKPSNGETNPNIPTVSTTTTIVASNPSISAPPVIPTITTDITGSSGSSGTTGSSDNSVSTTPSTSSEMDASVIISNTLNVFGYSLKNVIHAELLNLKLDVDDDVLLSVSIEVANDLLVKLKPIIIENIVGLLESGVELSADTINSVITTIINTLKSLLNVDCQAFISGKLGVEIDINLICGNIISVITSVLGDLLNNVAQIVASVLKGTITITGLVLDDILKTVGSIGVDIINGLGSIIGSVINGIGHIGGSAAVDVDIGYVTSNVLNIFGYSLKNVIHSGLLSMNTGISSEILLSVSIDVANDLVIKMEPIIIENIKGIINKDIVSVQVAVDSILGSLKGFFNADCQALISGKLGVEIDIQLLCGSVIKVMSCVLSDLLGNILQLVANVASGLINLTGSILGSAIGTVGSIGSGILSGLGHVINGLGCLVGSVTNTVGSVVGAVGDTVGSVVGVVGDTVGNILTGTGHIVSSVGNVIPGIHLSPGVGIDVGVDVNADLDVGSVISQIINVFGYSLKNIIHTELLNLKADVDGKVLLSLSVEIANDILSNVKPLIIENAITLLGSSTEIGVDAINAIISTINDSIKIYFNGDCQALISGKLGIEVNIDLMCGNVIKGITSVLGDLLNSLVKIVANVGFGVLNLAGSVIDDVFSTVGKVGSDVVKGLGLIIGAIVKPIGHAKVDVDIDCVIDNVINIFGYSLKNIIYTDLIHMNTGVDADVLLSVSVEVANDLLVKIKPILVENIVSLLNCKKINLSAINSVIKTIITALNGFLNADCQAFISGKLGVEIDISIISGHLIPVITCVLGDLLSDLAQLAANVISGLVNLTGGVLCSSIHIVGKVASDILNGAGAIVGTLLKTAGSIVNVAGSVVGNVVGNVVGGVGSVVGGVVNGVGKFFKGIKNGLKQNNCSNCNHCNRC